MKVWITLAVVIGGLFLLWVGWGAYVILTTERPAYEVVRELPSGVEVRQYGEQTWISTEYGSDNASFRVLASYIFGGNEQGESVAMTAPVITDDRMAFIMPEGVTPENAPTPDGQPISFQTVPPRKVATLAFSWTVTPERVTRKTDELLAILEANGVRAKGQPFLMRYNDPATPPFMRRHEVAVEVE